MIYDMKDLRTWTVEDIGKAIRNMAKAQTHWKNIGDTGRYNELQDQIRELEEEIKRRASQEEDQWL